MLENIHCVPCDKADKKSTIPGWLIDKIAEDKLKGGFNCKRSNQCKVCFQLKSDNQTCGCF